MSAVFILVRSLTLAAWHMSIHPHRNLSSLNLPVLKSIAYVVNVTCL
jgi:hypothetical protein